MSKQVGIESEYFIAKTSDAVPMIIPDILPQDESGILLEVRGKPGNPFDAVGSFLAEYFRYKERLEGMGLYFLNATRIKLHKTLKLELSRQFAKPLYKAQNLYKDDRTHVKHSSYQYAGLHIHFSNNYEHQMYTPDGQYSKMLTVPQILDIPKIVRKMDEQYKDIILSQYRNIGCYELKGDNFEYRSMPTFWIEELEDIESLISIANFAYSLF